MNILAFAEGGLPFVRVIIAGVDGSAPREAGASMQVRKHDFTGTIGGGQLEFEAIAHARNMIEEASRTPQTWRRDLRAWPLGPSLGQCCGGAVRVLFELFDQAERNGLGQDMDAADWAGEALIIHPLASGAPLLFLKDRQEARNLPLPVARAARDMLSGARPRQTALIGARDVTDAYFIEPMARPRQPLFIYGAGHVGRAIVKVIEDLDFAAYWVDVAADRFPDSIPHGIEPIIAANPVAIAEAAPEGAYHLVLTYSHALDLAICHAVLTKASFGFLGLIGSKSKRARFLKRLGETGIAPANLARLICPIGIGALRGKAPATIAISVAVQLVERLEADCHSRAMQKEGKLGGSGRISS